MAPQNPTFTCKQPLTFFNKKFLHIHELSQLANKCKIRMVHVVKPLSLQTEHPDLLFARF